MFITLKNAAAVQEPPPPVPMLFKSANGESKINLSLKTENSRSLPRKQPSVSFVSDLNLATSL